MSVTRIKQDSLGAIEVQADKFWGAETIHSSRSAPFIATSIQPHPQALLMCFGFFGEPAP
jgi:fumarate hydratase class II